MAEEEGLDAEVFGKQLSRLAAQASEPLVLIHLGEVTYISSRGLGKLVALYKQLRAQGGGIALFALRPNVRDVFRITRTDELFELQPAEAFPSEIPLPEGEAPVLAELPQGTVVVYAPKGNVF